MYILYTRLIASGRSLLLPARAPPAPIIAAWDSQVAFHPRSPSPKPSKPRTLVNLLQHFMSLMHCSAFFCNKQQIQQTRSGYQRSLARDSGALGTWHLLRLHAWHHETRSTTTKTRNISKPEHAWWRYVKVLLCTCFQPVAKTVQDVPQML